MLKAFLRHPYTQSLFVHLLTLYGRLVFATSKVRTITPTPPELEKGPVMLALWHQHIFAVPLLAAPNPCKLMGLMSPSRDGQLTRAIAARYGIAAAVGSSHRGGLHGARSLIRATRGQGPYTRPHTLFLTPDGPRGPARAAKPGASEIAHLTGLPLIPAAMWCTRGHTFAHAWDSFRLPYPFTTFHLAYGAPLPHPSPKQLAKTLNSLTAQAQAAAAGRQP